MHYYQFNIGDYLSHTTHLTDAEDLAYRRMLDLYYQSEKPFHDVEQVARRIRSTPETVLTILHEFFVYDDIGYWHNTRADLEIGKYHSKADSARKANQKRWASESDLKSDTDQILNKKQEPINNNQEPTHIRAKRATQIPDDFKPSDDHIKLGNELGVLVANEFTKFNDYCAANGKTYKDWNAAFRNWLRNAAQYSRTSTSTSKPAARHSFKNVDYGESGKI